MADARADNLIYSGFSSGMARRLSLAIAADSTSVNALLSMGFPLGQATYLRGAIQTSTCDSNKLIAHGMNHKQADVLAGLINHKVPVNIVEPTLTSSNGDYIGSLLTLDVGQWDFTEGFVIEWYAGADIIPGYSELTLQTDASNLGDMFSARVIAYNYTNSLPIVTSSVGPMVVPIGGL